MGVTAGIFLASILLKEIEVLSDSDVEPTEGQRPPYVRPITTHKNPGNKESTFDKTLITDSPPQNSYSKSKTSEGPITILGDSMIKMINLI
jgi:hypothetical protein